VSRVSIFFSGVCIARATVVFASLSSNGTGIRRQIAPNRAKSRQIARAIARFTGLAFVRQSAASVPYKSFEKWMQRMRVLRIARARFNLDPATFGDTHSSGISPIFPSTKETRTPMQRNATRTQRRRRNASCGTIRESVRKDAIKTNLGNRTERESSDRTFVGSTVDPLAAKLPLLDPCFRLFARARPRRPFVKGLLFKAAQSCRGGSCSFQLFRILAR